MFSQNQIKPVVMDRHAQVLLQLIEDISVIVLQIKSWDKTAQELHNWIRGCDHNPGAWCLINGQVTNINFNLISF